MIVSMDNLGFKHNKTDSYSTKSKLNHKYLLFTLACAAYTQIRGLQILSVVMLLPIFGTETEQHFGFT